MDIENKTTSEPVLGEPSSSIPEKSTGIDSQSLNGLSSNSSSKNRLYILLYVILGVLFFIGALYVFLYFKENLIKNNSTPEAVTQVEFLQQPGLEEMKGVVLRKAKLTFPDIESEDVINANSIPSEFGAYISDGAENLRVKKVVYADKISGYIFEYSSKGIVQDRILEIKKNAGVRAVNTQWTEKFGLLEIEGVGMIIQVTITELSPGQVVVILQGKNRN